VRVILDTNVLVGPYHRKSGPFRLLLEQARRGQIVVELPEVVILETVRRYRAEVAEWLRSYKDVRAKLRYVASEDLPALDLDADGETARYEQELRRDFDSVGAIVGTVPRIEHVEVARRDLDQKRPFDSEGRGYRDTVVWHAVLEALDEDDEVAFVSNDRDFRANDELHPDLVADLEAVGHRPEQLTLYKTLAAFVEATVPPAIAAVEEVRRVLAHNDAKESFGLELQEAFRGTREEEFEDLQYFSDPTIKPDNVELVTAWPEEIEVLTGQDLGGGSFNVDMRVVVDTEFDVYLYKGDAALLRGEDADRVMDWDHNEWYVRASVGPRAEASVSAIYNRDSQTLENVYLDAVTSATSGE
jgi:predicted nucleic acid-binding protein